MTLTGLHELFANERAFACAALKHFDFAERKETKPKIVTTTTTATTTVTIGGENTRVADNQPDYN